MVETVLAMIAEARSRDAYDNYIHVSGDTYPIVTDIELHSFITREILSIDLNETSPNHPDFKRIQKVYLPDCAIGALSPRHWAIERYIDSDFPSLADIEHAIDIKSTQFPWRYAKGSNWWKLSNSAIETILQTVSNAREFINWFRFSAHPDEAFFNTIILNFHKFAEVRPNPVFTKWDGGASPRVLTDLSDLAELQSSAKPFARKFSEASFELLSAMDHELRRKGSARQD